LEKALRIVVDSKCDFPSACNSMETLLIHRSLFFPAENCPAEKICKILTDNGVVLHAGHELINQAEHLVHLFSDEEKVSYKEEYGDLALTVECVDDIYNAVLHINTYGSGHTDSIVAEDPDVIDYFLKHTDSACVFENGSVFVSTIVFLPQIK